MAKKIVSGIVISILIVGFGFVACKPLISESAANLFANSAAIFCLLMAVSEMTSLVVIRDFRSPFCDKWLSTALVVLEFLTLFITLVLVAQKYFDFRDYLLVIVVCGATDAGGGIVGAIFGKTKVKSLEKISANKTQEGYLGAFLFAIGFSCLLAPLFYRDKTLLGYYVVVGFAFGILGDLLASHLKRCFGAKESGEILWNAPAFNLFEFPLRSHGGYLDRMDSMSFGLIALAIIKTVLSTL